MSDAGYRGDMDVVGLGVWCDYLTEAERRASWEPPASRPTGIVDSANPQPAVAPVFDPGSPGTLHFVAEEFAVLDDGTLLRFPDGRGWGISASGGRPASSTWERLTVESVTADALTVVLPDDAEVIGEEHSWTWLASSLAEHGVVTTPAKLTVLPYEVVLSHRLLGRLSGSAL
jgi:hypothetical protein